MAKKQELKDLESNYSVTIIYEDGEIKNYTTSKQLLLQILQLTMFEEHRIKEIHYYNLKLRQNEDKKQLSR